MDVPALPTRSPARRDHAAAFGTWSLLGPSACRAAKRRAALARQGAAGAMTRRGSVSAAPLVRAWPGFPSSRSKPPACSKTTTRGRAHAPGLATLGELHTTTTGTRDQPATHEPAGAPKPSPTPSARGRGNASRPGQRGSNSRSRSPASRTPRTRSASPVPSSKKKQPNFFQALSDSDDEPQSSQPKQRGRPLPKQQVRLVLEFTPSTTHTLTANLRDEPFFFR